MTNSKYARVGRIALWEHNGAEGAPVLRGEIELDGRKLRVSVWPEDRKTPGGPTLTGSVESDGSMVQAPAKGLASAPQAQQRRSW